MYNFLCLSMKGTEGENPMSRSSSYCLSGDQLSLGLCACWTANKPVSSALVESHSRSCLESQDVSQHEAVDDVSVPDLGHGILRRKSACVSCFQLIRILSI